MNLSSSFNKSLRSHGSFKCSGDFSDVTNEQPPILSTHQREVILKIGDNATDNNIDVSGIVLKESNSFRFCTSSVEDHGEISLDVNSEARKLQLLHSCSEPPKCEAEVKESKVSFKTQIEVSSSDDDLDPDDDYMSGQQRLRRRVSNVSYRNSASNKGLKCRSILKGKSRLADPPVSKRRSSQGNNSGRGKSGEVEKASDKDDDETSNDDDVPLHLKKLNFNTVTLLECISLVLIVTFLLCTLGISKWKRKELHGLKIWKWEVLSLVLICGRLVSDWVVRFVVLCIERNFMLRKRVVYFVYALRKSVQNCVWLSLVLVAWNELFDMKVLVSGNRFVWFVDKFLWCMLAFTLIWLVKTLIIKVLASSFHVQTFFDRIQDTLFNQYVIEMLSGPPIAEIHEKIEEEGKLMVEISKFEDAEVVLPPELREAAFRTIACGDKVKQRSGITPNKKDDVEVINKKQEEDMMLFSQLHKLNRKNVSAWNMKRLIKLVRYGALTTLDEHLQGLSTRGQDPSTKEISSEHEAKVAARKIFLNVVARRRSKSKYIHMQDLLRFLGDQEAERAMETIEGIPGSYKISKKDLRNWVVNAFRERKALAFSLNDTKTAVNKLHTMVNVLVGIVIGIISLIILGVTSRQFLVTVSSQLVVVTFIFGNTCKTIFEALIFLFVMHPFDVGDRCEIEGVQMVVEEMNILTTVFLRYDSQKIIYPNSTLSTVPIHNLYRSPDMDDSIDFWFHIATPSEKINVVKQRIISYIDNKKDHWYSNPIIVMRDIVDLHKIQMSLWPTHKMNHQNAVERYKRRGLLVEQIVKIVKEMDIEHLLYPIDINIRNMPTANSTPTNLALS
ncbi:mechanosensitive ion channel protein 8-like [Apium graveolens]|uniref:mechanosensitive ion channel protein 8-like n=1 Tax=Apium graveolens TaxID=4045 RepID=UPI003D7AE807